MKQIALVLKQKSTNVDMWYLNLSVIVSGYMSHVSPLRSDVIRGVCNATKKMTCFSLRQDKKYLQCFFQPRKHEDSLFSIKKNKTMKQY